MSIMRTIYVLMEDLEAQKKRPLATFPIAAYTNEERAKQAVELHNSTQRRDIFYYLHHVPLIED